MKAAEPFYRDKYRRPGEPDSRARQKTLESRVRRLRRSVKQAARCSEIADAIEACEPRHRCLLAACPHCSIAHQRWLIEEVGRLWGNKALTQVTMVPVSLQQAPGSLAAIKIASVRRNLRRIFERAGVDQFPVVGNVDLSFNIHADNTWRTHWQPHLEFLTPTKAWKQMRLLLRAQLTTSPPVKIPLLGMPVKDFEAQVSYVLKPTPVRKTYFEATSPAARPHKQALKSAQELEFLLWLDPQRVDARIFMIGVRQYGNQLRRV